MTTEETAMRDTMHHFSMFINRYWWTEQATPSNIDTMNMQLRDHFGSVSCEPAFNPTMQAYNVVHRFPDYEIAVSVESKGTVTIRGSVKNRANFDSPEVKSAMKAA